MLPSPRSPPWLTKIVRVSGSREEGVVAIALTSLRVRPALITPAFAPALFPPELQRAYYPGAADIVRAA